MTVSKLPAQLAAEFLGSMFLVMAAMASIIMFIHVLDAPKSVAILANAMAVAFVLATLIEMFGPISGAHFNPVVTLVMMLDRRISHQQGLLFMASQFIGGLVGTAFSRLMFLEEMGTVLAISTNDRSGHTFFGEVVGTFILLLAILLLVKHGSGKISILLGMLVGGQLMSTSSTMFANPQVTVARMFTNSASGIRPVDGLVFIAMQVVGALLAYGVFRFMFQEKVRATPERSL